MQLEITVHKTAACFSCSVSGLFNLCTGTKAIDTVLSAIAKTEKSLVLVDATQIGNEVNAMEKIMWAYEAQREFELFVHTYNYQPRIAIYGTPPFITKYKPASNYFRDCNIPIRTFDSVEEAKLWLFQEI